MIRLRAQLAALFTQDSPFDPVSRTCQMGRATGTLPDFIYRENVLETEYFYLTDSVPNRPDVRPVPPTCRPISESPGPVTIVTGNRPTEKAGAGLHQAENKNHHADLLPPICRSADRTAQEKRINTFWYISHLRTIMFFKYAYSQN
jgi:hypothetical protein